MPVIKVSTKGSRSRIVQLDLSFDAKEHHGLEALDMIRHILEVRFQHCDSVPCLLYLETSYITSLFLYRKYQ